MSRLRALSLVAAAMALASAVPVLAQIGGVEGTATLKDGSPCVKCPVILERQEVTGKFTTKTDKKGFFIHIGLPIGNYKATLQDPEGRTLFYVTKHVGLGDPTNFDMDLKKEMAQQKQANPELQKQLEEQAKSQKQMAGLKEFYEQGNQLYTDKKYPEAAAAFEQALPFATGPNEAVVLGRLGDAYHMAHKNDKALENYQKAIALNPQNVADLHNNLGSVYADMGKVPEAQAEFQKAAELNPTNAARYYYNLGAILTNTGKLDEAAAAFRKATEIDPKYADAYFLLGQSLMGKATLGSDGKITPAPGTVEALQTYLQLDPNGKFADAAKGMLQSITGSIDTEYKKTKKKK